MTDTGPPSPSPRALILVTAAGLTLMAVVGVWFLRRSAGVESRSANDRGAGVGALYVGDASCRKCHPAESALHQKSGHALTLQPVAERDELLRWLDGRKAGDPEYPEAAFTFHVRDGRLNVERSAPGEESWSTPIGFAFGSGHHATTFVTMGEPIANGTAGIEHRLTYFATDRRLAVTPGQDAVSNVESARKTPRGRLLNASQARKCFDCHTTRVSDRDPKTLDLATMIPNVSCERCHGPGKAHVEAAGRGETRLKMPGGPSRSTAATEVRLCGHCHRLPEMAPPGAIRSGNTELVRFQPVGLLQSKCYKQSDGALSCTTCHDPHARASDDSTTYNAVCLKCHQAPPQTVCGVGRGDRCIDCHMPRRDAGQKILFADHWIRVHPQAPTTVETR